MLKQEFDRKQSWTPWEMHIAGEEKGRIWIKVCAGTGTGTGKRMLSFYQTWSFLSVCLYVCTRLESVTNLENSVLKHFATLGRLRLRGFFTKGCQCSLALLSFTCWYITKCLRTTRKIKCIFQLNLVRNIGKKGNINYIDFYIYVPYWSKPP